MFSTMQLVQKCVWSSLKIKSHFKSSSLRSHCVLIYLWFQRTENIHQNSMLFSGEMQYRRVWGYYGGFSQLWEGTKKRSEKTDVFFAQRGPNGFRMCLFWSRLDAAAASAASSMLASKTHDEENVHASPVTFFFGAAGTPWEGEQSYQNIFALDCKPFNLSCRRLLFMGQFSDKTQISNDIGSA